MRTFNLNKVDNDVLNWNRGLQLEFAKGRAHFCHTNI